MKISAICIHVTSVLVAIQKGRCGAFADETIIDSTNEPIQFEI